METRTQRIVIETHRHRIAGELTMPREGYRSRISDYLNHGDLSFIPLANATIDAHDAHGEPITREFIAVAATQVQLVYPDED